MSQIRCPKCGNVFAVDESDYSAILAQVRGAEFDKELAERLHAMEASKAAELELAVKDVQVKAKEELAAKEARALELRAGLETQIQKLQSDLEAQAQSQATQQELAVAQAQAKLQEELSAKEAELSKLQAAYDAQVQAAETQRQLAVAEVEAKAKDELAAKDRELDRLSGQVEQDKADMARMEAEHKSDLADALATKDTLLQFKEEEIERLKDMKARLSTKMLGETLEQHCEIAFNKIRAAAFPRAYFEKDNDASGGTKGDYIFRECDENGVEIVSIMFEMKNEADDSTHTKKNEDHFKKLDKDRREKGCEYAVLVSLLEPDNEFYNEGIVDVSFRYEKMYVVRPQFFIPIITVLRNAALNSMAYRTELALVKQQNIDVTHFEEDLDAFKEGFFRNFQQASDRFEDAIEGIDRTIKALEKIRDNLTKSEKHLVAANNKLDDLTVRKLTRGNPTMQAKFEEAREQRAEAGVEAAEEGVSENLDL